MKKRLIAALAAVGLVAAMSGFGTLSAAADEPEDQTAVVDQSTGAEPEDTTADEEQNAPDEEQNGSEEEQNGSEEEQPAPDEENGESEEDSSSDEPKDETPAPEESKVEEPAATLPVVDGFTDEQVAQAIAAMADYGLAPESDAAGFAAKTIKWSVTICHAGKWGWDAIDVDLLGYFLHWIFDWEYDILPPILNGTIPGNNWEANFDGLYGWEIYANDCSKKVYVEYPPYWLSNEYCWDGYAHDGSLEVYYSIQMLDRAVWVITDEYGFYYEVPFAEGWNEIFLPAGYYDVELVPLGAWHVKHGGPYEITIWQAINCGCEVNVYEEPNTKDKVLAELVVEPLTPCAEAEVSVAPPTCEAASSLVLGDTFLAEWGDPEYEGLHYTVTAYADDGYRFYPGEGVPADGLTKTFEGDLAPKLTNCGGLPVTGAGDTGTPLWLAGLAVIAGIGALVVSTRRGGKVTAE